MGWQNAPVNNVDATTRNPLFLFLLFGWFLLRTAQPTAFVNLPPQ